MTVNEIAEKYSLDSQEVTFFNEYLDNKFIKEVGSPNTDMSFIDKWRDIYSYSVTYGVG